MRNSASHRGVARRAVRRTPHLAVLSGVLAVVAAATAHGAFVCYTNAPGLEVTVTASPAVAVGGTLYVPAGATDYSIQVSARIIDAYSQEAHISHYTCFNPACSSVPDICDHACNWSIPTDQTSLDVCKIDYQWVDDTGQESPESETVSVGISDLHIVADGQQVGGMVPSVRGADGELHYVTTKDPEGIEYAHFTVDGLPAGVVFNDVFEWIGGTAVTGDQNGTHRRVARASCGSDKTQLKIAFKESGDTCALLNVWVVWVALTAHLDLSETELDDDNACQLSDYPHAYHSGHLGLSMYVGSTVTWFSGAIEWCGEIAPHAIVLAENDVPDLRGQTSTVGVVGADRFWDMTREKKRRAWVDGNETTEAFAVEGARRQLEWGSDDPDTGDEDNNPYDGPRACPGGVPTGKIFSFDAPAFTTTQLDNATNGVPPGYHAQISFVKHLVFREYARIKLNGSYVRCSEYGEWKWFRSVKRVDGTWEEDSTGGNVVGLGNSGF